MPISFYQKPEWYRLRNQALRRDGHRCVSCGDSVRGKGKFRVDHIQPVMQRPDLALQLSNVRTLCVACDNARHSERRTGVERVEVGLDGYPLGSEWSD